MSDHTLEVNAVENGAQPKAIVMLFGWLGSQPKHVQKYSKLYQDFQCSTIHGTAGVVPVMLSQTEELQSFTVEAAKEACKLLRASAADEDTTSSVVPVIVHAFSGAGCIVLEQLEILIAEAECAKAAKSATTQQQEDLILLGDAMHRGGQVFDSAPAYLSTRAGFNAIGLAVPNIVTRLLIQGLFLLFALFQWAVDMNRAEDHWSHFKESEMALRQAYVYSSVDSATNSVQLDELIAYRRKKIAIKREGATVLVQKFADSSHCAHLVKYPKEYKAFVASFLGSIAEQQKEEELLDQDPDMTDYQMVMD